MLESAKPRNILDGMEALAKINRLTPEVDTNPYEDDWWLLPSSDISIVSAFHIYNLGTIASDDGPEPVFIEWITYGPDWDEKLHARVPEIAKLFSNPVKVECSGLRVLPCKGYYQDWPESRYGLVYRIPTLNPSPITLQQLIRDTDDRNDQPVLGELFELARKIVHCVLEVHKAGWVHRIISSYNIIFLPSTASVSIPVTSPYLIGFSHSHRDDPRTFTVAASDDNQRQYHHPDYLGDDHGFRPQHDFYSVGLVLLEIERRQPLNQLTRRMRGLAPQERLQALVRECVDNLGKSMGAHYCEAVRVCLTTDFATDCGSDGIQTEFETKVVNRLAKCQA